VIFIVSWDRLFSEGFSIVLMRNWRKDIEGTEVRSLSGALNRPGGGMVDTLDLKSSGQ
jgi:hypothetical protein